MADNFDDVKIFGGLSRAIVRGPPPMPGQAPLRLPMILLRSAIIVLGAAIFIINFVSVGVGLDGSMLGDTNIDKTVLYCSLPVTAVVLINTSIDLVISKAYKRMPSQRFVIRIIIENCMAVALAVCAVVLAVVDRPGNKWDYITVGLLGVTAVAEIAAMPMIVLQAQKTAQIMAERAEAENQVRASKVMNWGSDEEEGQFPGTSKNLGRIPGL